MGNGCRKFIGHSTKSLVNAGENIFSIANAMVSITQTVEFVTQKIFSATKTMVYDYGLKINADYPTYRFGRLDFRLAEPEHSCCSDGSACFENRSPGSDGAPAGICRRGGGGPWHSQRFHAL
jgi:hypothetical protein